MALKGGSVHVVGGMSPRRPPMGARHAVNQLVGASCCDTELGRNVHWDGSAAHEFSSGQIDAWFDAAADIERTCLLACAVAVARHSRGGLPADGPQRAAGTKQRREQSLYGRLDLNWHRMGPLKHPEYNAVTPTTLYEAFAVHLAWL